MPTSEQLVAALAERGVTLVSGVPCSLAPGFVAAATAHPTLRWVPAVNEGDAVAVAAGSCLGGRPAAVLLQNSGLGNAVNPLSSLTATFGVPVLLLITWRGQPGGAPDEPQHQLMGAITRPLLDLLEVPQTVLGERPSELGEQLDELLADQAASGRSQALVIPRGVLSVGDGPGDAGLPVTRGEVSRGSAPAAVARAAAPSSPALAAAASHGASDDAGLRAEAGAAVSADASPALDPDSVLSAVAAALPEAVLVATTGLTGRALLALGERPNHLAMVGSMGCASSLGLGLALARPGRRVVVLDGDGALLMRLGALASVAREAPANLTHLLLDNGRHESTGGQPTLSAGVDACAVARGCGYVAAHTVANLSALERLLADPPPGPVLLHLRTASRAGPRPPRPTRPPAEAAAALRAWLRSSE